MTQPNNEQIVALTIQTLTTSLTVTADALNIAVDTLERISRIYDLGSEDRLVGQAIQTLRKVASGALETLDIVAK